METFCSVRLQKWKEPLRLKKKKDLCQKWVLKNVQDGPNPEECGELQAKAVQTDRQDDSWYVQTPVKTCLGRVGREEDSRSKR